MSYGTGTYSRIPYAADQAPAAIPGQVIPPPIPGAQTRFQWVTGQVLPYGMWGYAGGTIGISGYLGGGVLLDPDPDAGVMHVSAWWPDAPYIMLARVGEDGVAVPVRGGNPVVVSSATRRNYATNPSCVSGLNGYVQADGSPTLTQGADSTIPQGHYAQTVNSSAGSNGLTIPSALKGNSGPVTLGFLLWLSARATSVTITVAWSDISGNALASNTATLTANQINASINTWARQTMTLYPPVGAYTPSIKVVSGGMPAAGIMRLSNWTHEIGVTDGSYLDGDSPGGQWTGTAELSASVIAPIVTVDDGECPLDINVRYIGYSPSLFGGRAVSDPAVLLSPSDSSGWLTHPAYPGQPMSVYPTATPQLVRSVDQAINHVIGKRFPIVVSGRRLAPAGTLTLDCPTFDYRDALLAFLDDGSPLLLRVERDFGYEDMWLSIGEVTEDPGGRPAWCQTRSLSCPFQVVDAPVAPNVVAA